MPFKPLRTLYSAAAVLLVGSAAAIVQAQTVGPLRSPSKVRAAHIFIAGEIVSFGASKIRIEKIGGTQATLHITGSTEYASGAENLEIGKYIRVRAIQGPGGILTALTIWSPDENLAATEPPGRRQTGIQDPVPPGEANRGEQARSAADNLDDPGPPILRRRTAGDRSALKRRKLPEVNEVDEVEQPPQDFEFTPQIEQYDDTVLAKAIDVNTKYLRLQTNLICHQIIKRFESRNLGRKWKELDQIEAEVLIIQNQEHYQNLSKNGAQTAGTMRDQGGVWSTGEYGSMLYNLFMYGYVGRSEKSGDKPDEFGAIYEYRANRKQSSWTLHFMNETYVSAYDGRFWVDPESGNVTKVEMTAIDLPADYPIRSVSNSVRYGTVIVDGKEYWLPVGATAKSCVRHSAHCNRNDIAFTDYRLYSAESSIYQVESNIDFGAEAEPRNDAEDGTDQAPAGGASR